MADKKPEPSAGPVLLWPVIAFIFVLMVLSTYIGRLDLSPDENGSISPDSAIPTGEVRLGDNVVSKTLTTIRQNAGGPIIGEQAKRSFGTIMEGPKNVFGKDWVRIDYKDDPDGWVLLSDVTTNVGWFRALNVFPIVFDFFRPVGIGLTLIFLVLLVLVIIKQKKVGEFERKKKKTNQEMFIAQHPKEPVITNASGPINLPGVPNNLPTGMPAGLVFEKQVADYSGPKNERWERVERLMKSTVASEWRQAVIEADIILDDMLTRMGYEGNSIGDKLKQIEQSDFVTLNKAWEAHKVRNHLAHRGGDYIFPKNEVERVIGLYKQVFMEFYYI